MSFFNSIGRRVARVIKQRVADAQKIHDEMCRAYDQEAEQKKEDHAVAMVDKILGK